MSELSPASLFWESKTKAGQSPLFLSTSIPLRALWHHTNEAPNSQNYLLHSMRVLNERAEGVNVPFGGFLSRTSAKFSIPQQNHFKERPTSAIWVDRVPALWTGHCDCFS